MVHGWVSLEVSPGAFATDTVVRIDPVYSIPNSPYISWPTLYNVWPEGLTHSPKIYTPLQANVVLRLGYTLDMLAPDEPESELRRLRISPDGSAWEEVPGSSVDVVTRVVSGTVSELGICAVMRPWAGLTTRGLDRCLRGGGTHRHGPERSAAFRRRRRAETVGSP